MYPSTYYIDKTTGTIADTLLAYGFMEWLATLLPGGQGITLRLRDMGSVYAVTLDGIEGIPEEWVQQARQQSLLAYLYAGSAKKKYPETEPRPPIYDYDAKKDQRDAYWEAYRAQDNDLSHSQKEMALQEMDVSTPDSELPIYLLINTQKARNSYNKIVTTWSHHRDIYPHLADLILRLFGQFPNFYSDAAAEWSAMVDEAGLDLRSDETAVQIISPTSLKGGNQTKATDLVEGNVKEFWLLSYLRYVGLKLAAVPIRIQGGGGDRKTYVPMPRNMRLTTAREVLATYSHTMWTSSAIKSDILAVLRYMRVYVTGWMDGQGSDDPWDTSQPGDHASGVQVVFYKDMGSATQMMDMSILKLPRWMPDPQATEDANAYLALIKAHERIISNLREDRSEEIALLRTYRRFLTTGALPIFFDFCAGLGSLFMSLCVKGEGHRAYLFDYTTLERMINMDEYRTDYRHIFQTPGFLEIADAIRQATFMQQWHKSKNRSVEYQPEYGLGQKLRQKAQYPDKFLAELGAFIQRYQADTLRHLEHPRTNNPHRAMPSMEDLAEVAELVDRFGSEVVCELLVASGYSWPERRQENAEE